RIVVVDGRAVDVDGDARAVPADPVAGDVGAGTGPDAGPAVDAALRTRADDGVRHDIRGGVPVPDGRLGVLHGVVVDVADTGCGREADADLELRVAAPRERIDPVLADLGLRALHEPDALVPV